MEILRSAAAAFGRRGFDGTSVADIADALHMTKGSLYYYFHDKGDILYETQRAAVRRMLQVSRRIERLRAGADVRLQLLVRSQMRCMLEELGASAAHIEFHALPAARLRRIIALRDRYEARLRSVIEEGIRRRVFAGCDAKLVALAILGAMNWTVKWFAPGGPLRADEIAAEFSRFFVRGLVARGRRLREPPSRLVEEVLR